MGLGAEYYVPGLLLAVLPWLVVAFQPRVDRKLKARRSREAKAKLQALGTALMSKL